MGKLSEKYRQKLNRSPINTGSDAEGLESLSEPTAELSKENIENRSESSRENLYKIIETYMDGDADLKKLADEIVLNGTEALKAVADDDDDYLDKNPLKTNYLEVIVRTDGSRPSFMIRNGKPDENTSPVGIWSDIIASSAEWLTKAIACVGRIDLNDSHVGTGFLIHQNLILTNRHVLQEIATKENNGKWQIKPGCTIDFGYEFRAINTLHRRVLNRLVFCGKSPIDRYHIDHAKLDLALIELKPVGIEMIPLTLLSFGKARDWAAPDTNIYIVGYPGNPGLPGLKTYHTLLEQLFKSTYGCKRLAPGVVISSTESSEEWTVAHDATTLGGNSGSLLVAFGKESIAAGLHYGGTLKAPRENWGHILGQTLDSTDGITDKTLKDFLDDYQVKFADTI